MLLYYHPVLVTSLCLFSEIILFTYLSTYLLTWRYKFYDHVLSQKMNSWLHTNQTKIHALPTESKEMFCNRRVYLREPCHQQTINIHISNYPVHWAKTKQTKTKPKQNHTDTRIAAAHLHDITYHNFVLHL